LIRAADRLNNTGQRLRTPREVSDRAALRLDNAERGLLSAFTRRIESASQRLEGRAALLDSLSYRRVLDRGFVLVRDGSGTPLSRAAQVASGSALTLAFADGDIHATTDGPSPKRPAAKSGKVDPRQRSLL
ncbi:MAG: exodeoxyribonuclease VII large subunit, partial [Rhodospirillaceae bacterium]|nr:exodeoxyribonuclease VII large subunit [Rhodospirillaceae bacterium]